MAGNSNRMTTYKCGKAHFVTEFKDNYQTKDLISVTLTICLLSRHMGIPYIDETQCSVRYLRPRQWPGSIELNGKLVHFLDRFLSYLRILKSTIKKRIASIALGRIKLFRYSKMTCLRFTNRWYNSPRPMDRGISKAASFFLFFLFVLPTIITQAVKAMMTMLMYRNMSSL